MRKEGGRRRKKKVEEEKDGSWLSPIICFHLLFSLSLMLFSLSLL